MFNLPEEIINLIYEKYFTNNVLNYHNINRCHAIHYLNKSKTKNIRCYGIRLPNKYYCVECQYGTVSYY